MEGAWGEGKEALSFSKPPFRGPYLDLLQGDPTGPTGSWLTYCLPKPVRQGSLTAAGGVRLYVGWGAGMHQQGGLF